MRASLVAVAAALMLAACSGSDGKPAAVTGTTVAATTTTTPLPVVVTKVDAKLGEILADNTGLTLYTLTANNVAVPCDTSCAQVWPPLEVPPGGMIPTGGIGVGPLGVSPGPNNTQLVTYGGLPLYRFSQDKTPSDATGEGVKSFGGTWHVVKAGTGASSTTSPSSTTTTSPKTTAATEPDTSADTTPETTPDTTVETTTVTSEPTDGGTSGD